MNIIEILNLSLAFGIGYVCGTIFWNNTQPPHKRVISFIVLIIWVYLVLTNQLEVY